MPRTPHVAVVERRHRADGNSDDDVQTGAFAPIRAWGAVEIDFQLEPTAEAPRSARHLVTRLLAPLLAADRLDDVALITSELATNAVHHARSAFMLSVRDLPGPRLRISVSDDDDRPPHQVAARPGALSGRGLAMVASLSDSWGVQTRDHGKTVWAEVWGR